MRSRDVGTGDGGPPRGRVGIWPGYDLWSSVLGRIAWQAMWGGCEGSGGEVGRQPRREEGWQRWSHAVHIRSDYCFVDSAPLVYHPRRPGGISSGAVVPRVDLEHGLGRLGRSKVASNQRGVERERMKLGLRRNRRVERPSGKARGVVLQRETQGQDARTQTHQSEAVVEEVVEGVHAG